MPFQFVAVGKESGVVVEKGIVFKTETMAKAEAMEFISNYKPTHEKIRVVVVTFPNVESEHDWNSCPQEIIRGEM